MPKGRLVRRLLLTARLAAASPATVHLFPPDLGPGEMCALLIYR